MCLLDRHRRLGVRVWQAKKDETSFASVITRPRLVDVCFDKRNNNTDEKCFLRCDGPRSLDDTARGNHSPFLGRERERTRSLVQCASRGMSSACAGIDRLLKYRCARRVQSKTNAPLHIDDRASTSDSSDVVQSSSLSVHGAKEKVH